MLDASTLAAIRAAIRYNELGDSSPYRITFAGKGNSGGSFGVFQGDAHTDQPVVSSCLSLALQDYGVNGATLTRIDSAVGARCVENPLSEADTSLVNQALAAPTGRHLVDQMDTTLEASVIIGVEQCGAAAATVHKTLELEAILYIACWVNMTGAPTQVSKWIAGTTIYQLAPPAAPTVTGKNLQDYLQRTEYFSKNPHNFQHLRAAVNSAMH
ncbi:hypothetical protein AAKU55_003865 [Oxalobacteraceae bacterium GrIS 1.11]